VWRSLVAHLHGVQGVAGSNPATETNFRVFNFMNHHNYILTKELKLDLAQLKSSCELMRQLVLDTWPGKQDPGTTRITNSLVTQLFKNYNIFMYPYPEFHQLYSELKTMFREHCDTTAYYCQAWLNYCHTDEYIDWHRHNLSLHCGWHGFFCVDTEPSNTTYRLPDETEFDVVGKNNLLVLSENQGDSHRTWPWHLLEPRITIAFDIVPAARIDPRDRLNHWIPI